MKRGSSFVKQDVVCIQALPAEVENEWRSRTCTGSCTFHLPASTSFEFAQKLTRPLAALCWRLQRYGPLPVLYISSMLKPLLFSYFFFSKTFFGSRACVSVVLITLIGISFSLRPVPFCCPSSCLHLGWWRNFSAHFVLFIIGRKWHDLGDTGVTIPP